jgi:hypothetical protein
MERREKGDKNTEIYVMSKVSEIEALGEVH